MLVLDGLEKDKRSLSFDLGVFMEIKSYGTMPTKFKCKKRKSVFRHFAVRTFDVSPE